MAEKYKIPPISADAWAAIKRKSAFNLPDRPTERGMKPDEIRQAFYGPITDQQASVLAEIARVIGDANDMFALVEADGKRNNVSVARIEGGHRVTIVVNDVETCLDIMDGRDTAIPAITEDDEGKALVVEGGKLVYKAIESADLSELSALIGEGF